MKPTFFKVLILIFFAQAFQLNAQIPKEYKGKPFKDKYYKKGAQQFPGRVELAYYDLGGEGVAYHDVTPENEGSKACSLLLPENTGNWHFWTQATIGEIVFPKAGKNLLTLKYNKGSNLAYLDFLLVEPAPE
jgi:hypothetical protein